MTDHSVYKRFLSLVIALTVFFGIVVYVPSEEVLADVDNSNIELSDTVSVAGEDIIVGNGVYKILTKNGAAFTGLLNPNVESFTVPNTIKYLETTYKVSWIAQSAFEGNTVIKSVKIGRNVARICSRAFYGCTSLKSVSVGRGVSYTASDAYDNCPVLKRPGRYYSGTYNVGLAYMGKAPKPWRKTSAGRNGRGEMT